jgi:hypothetical protein
MISSIADISDSNPAHIREVEYRDVDGVLYEIFVEEENNADLTGFPLDVIFKTEKKGLNEDFRQVRPT